MKKWFGKKHEKNKKHVTPGMLGHAFEERVRKAFESNSYALIRKNYVINNYGFEQSNATKRELDLVMLRVPHRQVYIIECKAHESEDNLVSLDDVRGFKQKIINYNGLSANSLLVTDTDFSSKAASFCYQNNIELMNGERFRRMEREGSILTMMIMRTAGSLIQNYTAKLDKGLEALLRM